MARYPFIFRLIVVTIFLGLLCVGLPIEAASQKKSETTANQETSRSEDSIDLSGGQFAVHLSQDEINSIAQSLPEGEVRQMFKEKVATGAEMDKVSADEEPVEGEEIATLFYDSEKALSRVQEQIGAFFTRPKSTFSSREWTETLENLTHGKGLGDLMLSFFIVAVLIFCGLAVELLVRRFTEGLRRQILDTASLGRLQFLGRVVSHLLLNLLGLGTYMLTTFLFFAVLYDEGDPGFYIISMTILVSYYMRLAILVANLVLSPAAPTLRLFPMQDEDAEFLYRWFIRIAATMMVIATASYILLHEGGISQEHFEMIYNMAGMSTVVLVVAMIWYSRRRVAQAIWPGEYAGDDANPSLRARIARSWHWFAMLYVMIMGIFWLIKGLAEERGALIPMLTSIFLIPIFIGLSRWAESLLDIASGLSPSCFASQDTGSPEVTGDHEAIQSVETDERKAGTKSYLQQHLPLIKRILRILLAALMFFVILRLWGIDLPVGRMFTSTALNIIGLVLLGFVVWQFITVRIDRKLREEMPAEDEEMEEGGSGGSRVGTLLVLLRKFILSVLFVLVSLIILSSVGVNIGPLIAGAGVIGLAIGFGSQTLVKDILSGVFFLIDDAFRVGDYIETAGTKGMVEHISLRSVKLRHPRGMVFTIPFGDMGAVQNFSRDYIITKLDVRVRYDADVDKIRKIVKKISQELEQDEEIGAVLLDKIKSQGVREMDDSAMILRVKFKTPPGKQFVVRREVYRLIQERFREEGIEFAHRNVTVYLPPEVTGETSAWSQGDGNASDARPHKKLLEASAAGALAASQVEETEEESKK